MTRNRDSRPIHFGHFAQKTSIGTVSTWPFLCVVLLLLLLLRALQWLPANHLFMHFVIALFIHVIALANHLCVCVWPFHRRRFILSISIHCLPLFHRLRFRLVRSFLSQFFWAWQKSNTLCAACFASFETRSMNINIQRTHRKKRETDVHTIRIWCVAFSTITLFPFDFCN